ncbi:SAM-dependent methyltransferase [Vibrio sonorensis]|uniref:SAM-dependent methyltransferase n=1 Tax=Vibrio sonorensis TaxID=1004316 RepID=UPI0008DA6942|nr:cyclopropane-fatty-acyl-phospholipid synthase family protein [Vibrio sonorensis]
MNSQIVTNARGLNVLERSSRSLVMKAVSMLQFGSLTVEEEYEDQSASRREVFGKRDENGINAIVKVKHPGFYSRVLKGGSIAAAEAYMDGWWESPDLTAVTELMALNMDALDKLESHTSPLTRLMMKLMHWSNRNTISNSEKNIHAHYDLGNPLYELFLDKNMLYSSGIYKSSKDSLEKAQINKMDRLCRQLNLTEKDHVIEIGTGWGGMAIHMASHYGCKVTTTTISEEQYQYAKERIHTLGLDDQITLLKQDYRKLEGQYDKLVSIEMIEAVGKAYLESYMKKCQSLLKPGGLMAIQAITIADQRYDYYSNNVDFIQKYIFPGGFLPSITALTQTATKYSDLVIQDLFDIGIDYAKTLNDWLVRFDHNIESVKQLGYDERFIRMWRYYFCYCEGGFKARSISTVHVTFRRPPVK